MSRIYRSYRHIYDNFILDHYRKNMSAREIADILDIPKGTVISRYHYAKGRKDKNKYYPTYEGPFSGGNNPYGNLPKIRPSAKSKRWVFS